MGGGIFAKSFISTPIFKTLGRELIDSELVESRKKTGIFVNMGASARSPRHNLTLTIRIYKYL